MTTAETSTALSVNAASLGTPKYGTVIPNRIFVGGIAANTTEQELKDFFSAYGAVKDSKIIADRAGVSKGYGFITFETQEDAEKIIKKESDSLMFKERKLNIGPAVRKQQAFPRLYDPNLPASILFSQNTVPYTFPNSVAFFHGQEGSVYPSNIPMQTPPAAAYQGPVVMPQAAGQHSAAAVYVQPYAAYATPTAATSPQWVHNNQWRIPQSPTAATPAQYMYPAMQFTSEYPEMMGTMAQYQPEMIEAAAQEGIVDHAAPQYETTIQHHVSPAPPTVASTHGHSTGPHSAVVSVSAATAALQPPTYHVQLSGTNPAAAVAAAVAQQQSRGHHQAYKRPIAPTTPRKFITNGSTAATYSPRSSTPPCKIPALQRVITTKSGTIIMADLSSGEPLASPLTPPPTPDVTGM